MERERKQLHLHVFGAGELLCGIDNQNGDVVIGLRLGPQDAVELHRWLGEHWSVLAMHGATQPQLQVPPKPRWPRWRKP